MTRMTLMTLAAAFVACSSVEAKEPVTAPAATEAPKTNDAAWKYFGQPFALATSVPAATVLADPSQHATAPVRITGEFTQVCQKMGCWAVVRDDAGHTVRITMKDHSFGIDKDATGKACDVEGTLVAEKVDPKKLEHYAEEGATEHPETGKDVAWSLVASSVAIAR